MTQIPSSSEHRYPDGTPWVYEPTMNPDGTPEVQTETNEERNIRVDAQIAALKAAEQASS